MPPGPPPTFDAELAPELLGRSFASVEVDTWDGPYVTLPDVPHSPAPYYAAIDEFLGSATPFDFHFTP